MTFEVSKTGTANSKVMYFIQYMTNASDVVNPHTYMYTIESSNSAIGVSSQVIVDM